ncbi:hypothetical protein GCM10027432_24360 [Lysobacter fragariae]
MPKQADISGRLAACKALADRCEPLSPEELAQFNTARAREMQRAEARRRGQSPQVPLPLEEAA